MIVNQRGAELSSSTMLPSQTLLAMGFSGSSPFVSSFLWLNSSQRQKIIPKIAIEAIQMDQHTQKKSLIGIPYLSFMDLTCLVFLVRQVTRQTSRLFVDLGTASRPYPCDNTNHSHIA